VNSKLTRFSSWIALLCVLAAFAAMTFSQNAYEHRAIFLAAIVGYVVLHTASNRVSNKLRIGSVVLRIVADCWFALGALLYVRLVLRADDWSTKVEPGWLFLWAALMAVLLLHLHRWLRVRARGSSESESRDKCDESGKP